MTGGNTVVTERPRVLADFLNVTFDAHVADSAEACAWLRTGGWDQLEAWLAAHLSDRPRRAVTPPHEGR